MKNKIILRILLVIVIIINCVVIFNFSAEKSEKSDKTSGRVIDTIIEINPKTRNLSLEEKEKVKEQIITPVRKTAHFTIYLSLGFWTYLFFKTFSIKDKTRSLSSLLFCFIYACTDEFHQLFVPGRSGQLKDVCIDTCGALFGILIIYFVFKLIKRKSKV